MFTSIFGNLKSICRFFFQLFCVLATSRQVGSITFFCYGGGVLSSSLLIAPRVSWRQHRVSHNTRIKTFDIPKQDTWGF